ncbi:MAG: DNA primase [Elusimicrobia bacterium]|nr:DNA primase [Elusimicrobiota bacterium]
MEDKSQIWRDYKKTVLEKVGDFSDFFGHLRKEKNTDGGWVVGCCPFHDDHDPSFAYNRKTGRWACFSKCGKGGALDFLMQTTGASFKDALLVLGDKVGVPRPSSANNKAEQISETSVQGMAADLHANASVLRYLREKRGLTDGTIKKYQLGYDKSRRRISIPIRDTSGKLANIRFYSPKNSMKMINLKGFGNPARLYGADELVKDERKQVLLCEGEFDRLLLSQNGFSAVTSTHGCNSFRDEWLDLFKGKDVVVVYDCDPEGQAAVQGNILKAFKDSEIGSIKNVVLPLAGSKEDKDITDYFLKPHQVSPDLFDKRCYSAEDLQTLIDHTVAVDIKKFVPSAPSENGNGPNLLKIINAIRNAEDKRAHERNVEVGETISNHLSKYGAFYFDPKASAEYLCFDGRVYTIGNNRLFNSLLQTIGQLNITTAEGKYVWEYLRNYARSLGSPIRSASWVFGDVVKPAIYVHTHGEKGDILRLYPNSITVIPNGQNDDEIILNPSDRVQSFTYKDDVDMECGLQLLKQFVYDTSPCSEADKAFLLAYCTIIVMDDFCPMKPILRLSGVHGSGKTSVASTISHIVYGENVGKIGTMAALYTDASKNPLTFLDNLEARDFDKELLNFLLTASTGIVHEKKKLYTDQDIVRERAGAFIATTGIETLGKPELLSRQWEIACDAANFTKNFSEAEHLVKIKESRDVMLSAIFKLISQEIFPQIKKRKELEGALVSKFMNHPKRRTFGCLSLILIAWDALERILGLPADLDEAWILAQMEVSEETSQETNIFVQYLGLLHGQNGLSSHPGMRLNQFEGRPCFEATSMALHNVFSRLAKENGLPRPFDNPRQLGMRLQESLPTLEQMGWGVQLRVRVVHGDRYHRFSPPEEITNLTQNLGATL